MGNKSSSLPQETNAVQVDNDGGDESEVVSSSGVFLADDLQGM